MGPGYEMLAAGLLGAIVISAAGVAGSAHYVGGVSWPKAIGGTMLVYGTYFGYKQYANKRDFWKRKTQNEADQKIQLQNQLAESTHINATEWQNKLTPVNTAMQACLKEPTMALLTELGKNKNRNAVWRCNKYIDLNSPLNVTAPKFAPSVYSNA